MIHFFVVFKILSIFPLFHMNRILCCTVVSVQHVFGLLFFDLREKFGESIKYRIKKGFLKNFLRVAYYLFYLCDFRLIFLLNFKKANLIQNFLNFYSSIYDLIRLPLLETIFVSCHSIYPVNSTKNQLYLSSLLLKCVKCKC